LTEQIEYITIINLFTFEFDETIDYSRKFTTIMKRLFAGIAVISSLVFSMCGSAKNSKAPESGLGWKLGAQAYTFRMFSFFEALDKIDSCGLKYVEAYPGQKIGGGMEGNMDFKMDEAKRTAILRRAKEKGIKIVSFGVVSPANEQDWEQLFQFAQAMGLENITTEPNPAVLRLVSSLADKYKINVAIHNHPTPSRYWHPDTVLNNLRGLSARVGACADIGHWVRSGLDPVECLKKLEGHVIQLHMKDLHQKSRDAHDVPWGNGVSNIAGVMDELKRQGFKGLFSAEYEYNWYNSTPDVTASAKYFRDVARRIK
jgi:sugar phosphate isomerase/epimerase